MSPPPLESQRFRLLLAFAIAYPALVLYGSLFPVTEWRNSGLSIWLFLSSDFPRYWTVFDLLTNVTLYFPLGFLWALWLIRRGHPVAGPWVAAILASALSLGVEITQNWLPSRVPSNLDWLCNTVGALLGVALASQFDRCCSRWLIDLRRQWFAEDGATDLVLALLGFWMLAQLSPEGILFCSGLVGSSGTAWLQLIGSEQRLPVEATAVAMHTLLAGLLARQAMAGKTAMVLTRILLGALLVVLAKAAVSALGLGFNKAFVWMSNGAVWGVFLGAALLVAAAFLSFRAQRWIMLIALFTGSGSLLMLPESPYVPGMATELAASPLRNFIEVLHWFGVLWPVLVGAYLIWLLASRTHSLPSAGATRLHKVQ